MKIVLLALLPLGITAEEAPPSLIFLEYLGLSQELAEIGIDIDEVPEDSDSTEHSEREEKSSRTQLDKP
jgi:hypothetical protein